MSSNDFLPAGEAQFKAWYDNFVARCEEYEGPLGLDSGSFGTISTLNAAYNAKFSQLINAKDIYEGAVDNKNLARKESTANIRAFAKEFKAIQGISPNILQELGIVASTNTGPVTVVTSLEVSGCSDGVNKLKWNRNGNAQGTTFAIEYRIGISGAWSFAGTTTKVTFNHIDQVPGQLVWYRVTASRAGKNSVPCPAVAVYGPQGETELSIAA